MPIALRGDRYSHLIMYRNKLIELRNVGLGNKTKLGTTVTIELINVIQRRYDELQLRWKVYGAFEQQFC
jgi:hypothetical protein